MSTPPEIEDLIDLANAQTAALAAIMTVLNRMNAGIGADIGAEMQEIQRAGETIAMCYTAQARRLLQLRSEQSANDS